MILQCIILDVFWAHVSQIYKRLTGIHYNTITAYCIYAMVLNISEFTTVDKSEITLKS